MRINKQLLTKRLEENLNNVRNEFDKNEKVSKIVEALNHFDNEMTWVESIKREDILSLISNTKSQSKLIEKIVNKVSEGANKLELKESFKKTLKNRKLNESSIEEKKGIPEKSNLKKALDRFNSNGRYAKQGSWKIARGGYDLAFQIYYNDLAIIDGVNDGYGPTDIHLDQEDYFGYDAEELAKYVCSIYGDCEIVQESLKEEYGAYKGEDFCSPIADDLEYGQGYGYVIEEESQEEISWELYINGFNEEDFQCRDFFEYLCQDISYPVRDGHLAYMDLDEFLVKSFLDREIDLKELKHDLKMLDVDIVEFNKWLKSKDEEYEFFIDYDTNFDVDAYEEARYNYFANEEDDEDFIEDLDVDDVIGWISEHNELYDDFKYYFDYEIDEETQEEVNKPNLEEIVEWLSEHEMAWGDFKHYFNEALSNRQIDNIVRRNLRYLDHIKKKEDKKECFTICRGETPLKSFHSNDLPINRNGGYAPNNIIKFSNEDYICFNSKEEASKYIDSMKKQIEEERERYEKSLVGSTDKLLKSIDKLVICTKDNKLKEAYFQKTTLDYIQDKLDKEGIKYEVEEAVDDEPYNTWITILKGDDSKADDIICSVVGDNYEWVRDKEGNRKYCKILAESLKEGRISDLDKAILSAYKILKKNPNLAGVIYSFRQDGKVKVLNPVLPKKTMQEINDFEKEFRQEGEESHIDLRVLYPDHLLSTERNLKSKGLLETLNNKNIDITSKKDYNINEVKSMKKQLLYRLRENANTNVAMAAMADSDDKQEEPYIGPFWYDVNKQEVFGNVMTLASDKPFYDMNGKKAKTGNALHKNIWKKEEKRGKDRRFTGDYKYVPRGRVFEFENEGFKVYVGDWIDKYPEAKDEIIEVFQLPKSKTEFIKDTHWDLGHGWSDELYLG